MAHLSPESFHGHQQKGCDCHCATFCDQCWKLFKAEKRGQYVWYYYHSNLEKKKKYHWVSLSRQGQRLPQTFLLVLLSTVSNFWFWVWRSLKTTQTLLTGENICRGGGGTVSPAVAFCGTTAGWCKVTRRLRRWSEFHRAKTLSCFWFKGAWGGEMSLVRSWSGDKRLLRGSELWLGEVNELGEKAEAEREVSVPPLAHETFAQRNGWQICCPEIPSL